MAPEMNGSRNSHFLAIYGPRNCTFLVISGKWNVWNRYLSFKKFYTNSWYKSRKSILKHPTGIIYKPWKCVKTTYKIMQSSFNTYYQSLEKSWFKFGLLFVSVCCGSTKYKSNAETQPIMSWLMSHCLINFFKKMHLLKQHKLEQVIYKIGKGI